jgi:hypothetical protein
MQTQRIHCTEKQRWKMVEIAMRKASVCATAAALPSRKNINHADRRNCLDFCFGRSDSRCAVLLAQK